VSGGTTNTGPDCAGLVISLGANLVGDASGCAITLLPLDLLGDPGLDTFSDDGTPGRGRYPLLPASRAINGGNDAACPSADQLGHPRRGPCDIGAVEFFPVDLTVQLNQTRFRAEETLLVGLAARNHGPDVVGDVYFGLIESDGMTAVFLTSLAPIVGVEIRLDSDPRTFPPLFPQDDFPPGLDVALDAVLVHCWSTLSQSGRRSAR
jgi:hypothetical protein